MKISTYSHETLAAIEILRQTGVNVLEAALVAKEAIAVGRGRLKRARACIAAGAESLKKNEKTVTFSRAVEVALEVRALRRTRTISDFRYLTRRMMKRCPGLAKRRVRSITAEDCIKYLKQAFDTPRQRNKARLALSGVFTTARQHGWCSENPIREVAAEKVTEQRIVILKHEEISRLMDAASTHEGGACLAAVGMMLYAGIRPHEVERLRWADVRPGVICIAPQHSKTGGARHVTIHPPLEKLLRHIKKKEDEPICPPNWRRHWAELHRQAGLTPWQPDVLRHTFATHHLATFRSYAELQLEMGHRSAALLRTRYVAMDDAIYLHRRSILVG